LFAWALLLALCLPAQAASSFNLETREGNPGTPVEYAWHWMDKVLTIKDGADITITGAVTDGTRIEVAPGAKATITLDDVSITGVAVSAFFSAARVLLCAGDAIRHKSCKFSDIGRGTNQSPLALNTGANVMLNIRGNNTLTGGQCALEKASYCAGITVPSSTTLNIDGAGTLTATGGSWSAGIGGSGYGGKSRSIGFDAGTITISGGTVTATGGVYSSGIGAGNGGQGGTITISGGTVTARAGEYHGNNGIGGSGGAITISGGTVTAYGNNGPGIGGTPSSSFGGSDMTITISGGTVISHGGFGSAGIGGENYGTDSNFAITITGNANVTAMGGDGFPQNNMGGGAGIGSDGCSFPGQRMDIIKIKIDRTARIKARGGKGSKGGGDAEDIGQGGCAK